MVKVMAMMRVMVMAMMRVMVTVFCSRVRVSNVMNQFVEGFAAAHN